MENSLDINKLIISKNVERRTEHYNIMILETDLASVTKTLRAIIDSLTCCGNTRCTRGSRLVQYYYCKWSLDYNSMIGLTWKRWQYNMKGRITVRQRRWKRKMLEWKWLLLLSLCRHWELNTRGRSCVQQDLYNAPNTITINRVCRRSCVYVPICRYNLRRYTIYYIGIR